MSNAILPKEQQSAFERWEMRSFGEDKRHDALATANAPPAPKIGIEEIAAIREEARALGHAEGFAEGRAEGLEQGRAAGQTEMQHLQEIAVQLAEEATHADQTIANDVLELALDLAKAMLKTALTVRPELVVPIVAEAIRYLPSLQQPALLMLHPEDASIIKMQMHDELEKAGWRIVEDAHLQRGGCRIDTATNQIDASIDARWQRLAETLGKQSEWLS